MPPPNTPNGNGANSPEGTQNHVAITPRPRPPADRDTTQAFEDLRVAQEFLNQFFITERVLQDSSHTTVAPGDVSDTRLSHQPFSMSHEELIRLPVTYSDERTQDVVYDHGFDHRPIEDANELFQNADWPSEDADGSALFKWQDLEYVGQVDDDLLCGICKAPFHQPVTTKSCGHVFCSSCLNQYLEETHRTTQHWSVSCPMCRHELPILWTSSGSPLFSKVSDPCNRLVDNLLDKLEVKCPNNAELCEWIGPRSTAEKHVRDDCAYAMIPCAADDCSQKIARGANARSCLHYDAECKACGQMIDMSREQEHLNNVCTMYRAPCTACGKKMIRRDLSSHTAACWYETTSCAFANSGCPVLETRREIQAHEQSCVYRLIKQLEDRLMLQNNALDTMQRENRTMKHQLQETRLQLENLHGEHDTLREAVWGRNGPGEGDNPPASWPQITAQLVGDLEGRMTDLSRALTSQEGRQSTMLLSETTRIKQDLVQMRSDVGIMGMHVRWLMGDRTRQRQSMLNGLAAGSSNSVSAQEPASSSSDRESRQATSAPRPRAASNEPRPSL